MRTPTRPLGVPHTVRAGVSQAKEEERARLDAEALFAKKIEAMALNAKLQLVRRQARPRVPNRG